MYRNKKTDEKLTNRQYGNKLNEGKIILKEWVCFTEYPKIHLREWRLIKNLSMQEVVNQMSDFGYNYSWQYIQKLESGKTKPSYDFMAIFKIVFGESIDNMFFSDDEDY